MTRSFPIVLNFAGRDHRFSFRLVGSLVALCGVLVISIGLMFWYAVSLGTKGAELERQLAELDARAGTLRPVMEQRERLLRDLASMSGLMKARAFSWTGMLTGLEQAFPVGAAIEKLKFNPENRGLTIEGFARSPEALRNFMAGLEQSPLFADPLLKHQSIDKGILTFTVGVRYQ